MVILYEKQYFFLGTPLNILSCDGRSSFPMWKYSIIYSMYVVLPIVLFGDYIYQVLHLPSEIVMDWIRYCLEFIVVPLQVNPPTLLYWWSRQ